MAAIIMGLPSASGCCDLQGTVLQGCLFQVGVKEEEGAGMLALVQKGRSLAAVPAVSPPQTLLHLCVCGGLSAGSPPPSSQLPCGYQGVGGSKGLHSGSSSAPSFSLSTLLGISYSG